MTWFTDQGWDSDTRFECIKRRRTLLCLIGVNGNVSGKQISTFVTEQSCKVLYTEPEGNIDD